jgi:RimJ/RimL family protein N-acetyltransferase
LVAQDDRVVGSVAISRIDLDARTARLGYVLASPHQGQHHEFRAASAAFAHARNMGLREVSTTYSEQDADLRAVWEQTGHRVEARDGRLVADLS